jgi:putative serine protease PepD
MNEWNDITRPTPPEATAPIDRLWSSYEYQPRPAAQPSAPPAPQPSRRPRASWIVALLVVVSFLVGSLGGGLAGSLITASGQPAASASAASAQPIAQLSATGDTSAIFQAASPTVVEIAASTQDRWGRPFSSSTGSGFVVDAAGLILTNQHVVASASTITVRFSTGDERSASIVRQDSANDLALLEVDGLPDGVEIATLGNSDAVEVGEPAIAIGSPFGLEQTVTQGIVSAINRTWSAGSRVHRGLIQTDAPINPGNSGGPLLNARGEVIGITTMIESPVEGNVGIGFAVPINIAQKLLADGA